MELRNGIYYVNCKVNGIPLKFIFDTGASVVTLSSTEANFLVKNGLITEGDLLDRQVYKMADGKTIKAQRVILKKIEIGNKAIFNIEAIIISNQSAPLLLGQSALKKFGLYSVDYKSNILIFDNNNVKINPSSSDEDNNKISIQKQKLKDALSNGNAKRIGLEYFGLYLEYLNLKKYSEAMLAINNSIKYTLQTNNEDELYKVWFTSRERDLSLHYKERAELKMLLKDFSGAINDYNSAIEFYKIPNINLVEPGREVDLFLYKKQKEAEPYYYSELYAGRANVKYDFRDYKGALQDAEEAIRIHNDNEYAYFIRGISKIELNDTDGGCLDLSKAGEMGYSNAYVAIEMLCNK